MVAFVALLFGLSLSFGVSQDMSIWLTVCLIYCVSMLFNEFAEYKLGCYINLFTSFCVGSSKVYPLDDISRASIARSSDDISRTSRLVSLTRFLIPVVVLIGLVLIIINMFFENNDPSTVVFSVIFILALVLVVLTVVQFSLCKDIRTAEYEYLQTLVGQMLVDVDKEQTPDSGKGKEDTEDS
jgi:L-asparagine transporter-like permease